MDGFSLKSLCNATVALLLAAALGALQPQACRSAPVMPANEDATSELYFGSHLPRDREAQRQLSLARRLIDEGRFGDAAQRIDAVLTRESDVLDETGRSVRGQARQLLAAAGEELREAYASLYEPVVSRLLSESSTTEQYAAIAARFPAEAVGAPAWRVWARTSSDRGDQRLAAAVWRELIAASPAPSEEWRQRLAASESLLRGSRASDPSLEWLSQQGGVEVAWTSDLLPSADPLEGRTQNVGRFPIGGIASTAGLVIGRVGKDLIAWDATTGKQFWSVAEAWRRTPRVSQRRNLYQPLPAAEWRRIVDPVSIAGRLAVAVVDSEAAVGGVPANRLLAIDVRSGKTKWVSDDGATYFLTAPEAAPGGLATMVYRDGAIGLALIDHRTGRWLWWQPIVDVEEGPDANRLLGHYGVKLACVGQRVICTTAVGVTAAVDLVRRQIDWVARTPVGERELDSARANSRRRVLLGAGEDNRESHWRRAQLVVDGDLIVAASPESDAVLGIELHSGTRRWIKRFFGPIDVVGVHAGYALVLHKSQLTGIDLASGDVVGELSLRLNDEQPVSAAGRGLLLGDSYWFVSTGGALIRAPLSGVLTGEQGGTPVAIASGLPEGNLYAAGESLLVHNEAGVATLGRLTSIQPSSRMDDAVADLADGMPPRASVTLIDNNVYLRRDGGVVAPERWLAGRLDRQEIDDERLARSLALDTPDDWQAISDDLLVGLADALRGTSMGREYAAQWLQRCRRRHAGSDASIWQDSLEISQPTSGLSNADRTRVFALNRVESRYEQTTGDQAISNPVLRGYGQNREIRVGGGRWLLRLVGDDRWRLIGFDRNGAVAATSRLESGQRRANVFDAVEWSRFVALNVGGLLTVYDKGSAAEPVRLQPLWRGDTEPDAYVADPNGMTAPVRRLLLPDSTGRFVQAGPWGLITAHTAGTDDDLVCRRWVDGRVLWRTRAPTVVRIASADDKLCLDGPRRAGESESQTMPIVSAIDGSVIGKWNVPPGRWLGAAGGHVAIEKVSGGQRVLRLFDSVTGEPVDAVTLASSVPSVLCGGDARQHPLVAAMTDEGALAVFDVSEARERFRIDLSDEAIAAEEVRALVARRHGDSLVVAFQTRQAVADRTGLPGSPMVAGSMQCFDLATGQPLWAQSARLAGQSWVDLPLDAAPALVFGYATEVGSNAMPPEINLLAIDPATGRSLARAEGLNTKLTSLASFSASFERFVSPKLNVRLGPIDWRINATEDPASPSPPYDYAVENPTKPSLAELLRSASEASKMFPELPAAAENR